MGEKMNKVTDINATKVPISTKITTALIIVISILSVVTIIFIYLVQPDIKTNNNNAEKWGAMLDVVESEATEILQSDLQKQQLANNLHQQILYMNEWIIALKDYGSYNQSEIDLAIMQIAAQIELNNDFIATTYAHNWTLKNGGNPGNQYLGYRWIIDKFDDYAPLLDTEVYNWLNLTFFPNTPEILLIRWDTWEYEPLENISVVLYYGSKTAQYQNTLGINIAGLSTFDLIYNIEIYEENADLIYDVIDSLTSALLLMTISGVILAYVVSVEEKTYIWISLIVGAIISIIAVSMFTQAVIYHLENQVWLTLGV